MSAIFHDAMQQAAAYLVNAAKLRCRRELNLCRPSVLLRASVGENLDGEYTASYSGVFASGSTPEEAFQRFDKLWQQGE